MQRISLAVIAGIALVAANITEAASEAPDCRPSSEQTMQCFTIHGRLTLYNGTPGFRIWKIGSNRLFGVLDGTGTEFEDQTRLFPSSVQRLMRSDATEAMVYGDFKVCPLTPEQPGRMQMVCIAGASNLVAKGRVGVMVWELW